MTHWRHNAVTLALLTGLALPALSAAQAKPPQKQPGKAQGPGQLETLYRQAEEAIEKQDFAAAVPLLEKFLADRPDDPYAHFQLGFAFTGLKRWPDAATAFRKAIELKPDFAEAYQNLGLVLLRDNQPAAALDALRKAVELSPEKPQPLLLLGDALEQAGKKPEAIAQYEKAVSLAPQNVDARVALGRLLLDTGKPAEAEPHLRAALASAASAKPPLDVIGIRHALAESLIAQRKLAEAVPELEAVLEAKPKTHESEILLQLASLQYELGRFDKAVEALDRADQLKPGSPATIPLRADIYLAQKRYAEAAELLKSVVSAGPADPETRAKLGRVYLELRDFPNAEKELVAALRAKPPLTEALRDLVAVLYLAENYGRALNVIDQLAKREELQPGSWFIRATCYDKLQRKPEALEAYRKFVALDQGRSERQDFQARQRIKVLARELERKR